MFFNVLLAAAFLFSVKLRSQCSIGLSVMNLSLNCITGTYASTVSASGGTGPYTYTWLPSGGNSPIATNLPPASYTILATDAMGCVGNTALIILNNTSANIIMNATAVSCFNGSNGQIYANVTGSFNPPLSYSWTPPAPNSATVTNLSAGTYSVKVTDNVGCVYTASVILSQPTAITASVISKPINCYGSMSGATITASGGTTPYAYSWAPVSSSPTIANNIPAGNYSVNITDGMDGLSGGLLIFSFGAFSIISLFVGQPLLAAFCLTIVGALLTYTWFNIFPARFHMGDTGAPALGATLAVVALLT
ncbi:MAG: hypothetical protein ACXVPQ_08685, partial [Bacteroidia bacterium]